MRAKLAQKNIPQPLRALLVARLVVAHILLLQQKCARVDLARARVKNQQFDRSWGPNTCSDSSDDAEIDVDMASADRFLRGLHVSWRISYTGLHVSWRISHTDQPPVAPGHTWRLFAAQVRGLEPARPAGTPTNG